MSLVPNYISIEGFRVDIKVKGLGQMSNSRVTFASRIQAAKKVFGPDVACELNVFCDVLIPGAKISFARLDIKFIATLSTQNSQHNTDRIQTHKQHIWGGGYG